MRLPAGELEARVVEAIQSDPSVVKLQQRARLPVALSPAEMLEAVRRIDAAPGRLSIAWNAEGVFGDLGADMAKVLRIEVVVHAEAARR